ncbi:MAG: carboxypeptidase-like regulatory domain-containing protein, partial [Bacteroidetes bacterium]
MRILTASLSLLLLFVLSISDSYAQQILVTGKVTDARSGDPVPFANVIFKGTNIGATTNFEGRYEIRTTNPGDSVAASYIGYKSRVKLMGEGQVVVINFQLEQDIIKLREVVFVAGENPAFAIMRNAVANKDKHDKRNLQSYEYESYNKIEFDLDNLTEKFKSR